MPLGLLFYCESWLWMNINMKWCALSPSQLSIQELDFDKGPLNQVQFHSNSSFDLAFKSIWDRLLFNSSCCILLVLCHRLFQHFQLFIFVFQCLVVCACAYVVLVCILNFEAKNIGINHNGKGYAWTWCKCKRMVQQ